jgi:hypothetical protein
MSMFSNHAALFVEATKDFARADGVNRAFARGTGFVLTKARTIEALEALDSAAAESARSAPPAGSDTTAVRHTVEQARMHSTSRWWNCAFMNAPPGDIRANDEWHTAAEVRALVTHSDAQARINAA